MGNDNTLTYKFLLNDQEVEVALGVDPFACSASMGTEGICNYVTDCCAEVKNWNIEGISNYVTDCCAEIKNWNMEEIKQIIKKEEEMKFITLDHVIFDGPATIVFWSDGSKTIVKCTDGDVYAYDVGIAMATLKKIFGDQYGAYRHDVRNAIKEAEERKVRREKKKESKGETTMDDAIGLAKIAIGIMESFRKKG